MSTPSPLRLISSWNGAIAIARAVELHQGGRSLLPSMVEGVKIVEDDPEEMSVGFGGLPNEDGIVELDAAVMDGRTHRAGAVAGLRNVRHAAAVAYQVMTRTDHTLLVGDGATRFAHMLGFPSEELLTPKGRQAWLDWKAHLSPRDGWLAPGEQASDFGRAKWAGKEGGPTESEAGHPSAAAIPAPNTSNSAPNIPFTYGTIYMGGLDLSGDLSALTSTSGLSYKISGRVGDTPIIGGGVYVNNAIGTAGATGRGEAVMQSCGGFHAVARMESGDTPEQACLHVLRTIADRAEPRLRDAKCRPTFNVTMYAIRKDGLLGAASIHPGYEYTCFDGTSVRTLKAASVFTS